MLVHRSKIGNFRIICDNNELAVLTSLVDDAIAALGNGDLNSMERLYKHSLSELRQPLLACDKEPLLSGLSNTSAEV